MKAEGPESLGLAPSPELVRLAHEQRGHSQALRRVDGAQLLPKRRVAERRWRAGWPLATFAVVAAAVAVLVARDFTRPLSYSLEGAQVSDHGIIEPGPAAEAKLHFSDGTELSLSSGAKAVVRHVDDRGARVALTQGVAHVDVLHRAQSRWVFDAGPFVIAVTGTAFTFGWIDAEQRLDVRMERGSVEVQGPLTEGSLTIRAGQHLTVRVRERETVIRDADAEAAAPGPTLPNPPPVETTGALAPEVTGPGRPPVTSRDTAECKATSSNWAALLARGNSTSVLQQAERHGIDCCLTTSSSSDLVALADAARYARRDDLARRALLAQRRRFVGSAAAKDAAFLLGQLEETGGRTASALEWFDTYLSENPRGDYASQALGRTMILVQRTRGDEAARPFASQYRARFPDGEYAAAARALAPAP